MVAVTVGNANADYVLPFSNLLKSEMVEFSGGLLIFEETSGGDTLKIEGSGFKFEFGVLVEGTITGMTSFNSGGDTIATVTGANYALANYSDFENFWANKILNLMLTGDDKLTGSKGADELQGWAGMDSLKGGAGGDDLFGGVGNDELSGGNGADFFFFSQGDGDDTITDFAIGKKHDTILVGGSTDYSVKKSGHDLLLTFEDVTITLLDIKRAQFDDSYVGAWAGG